jgi:hypothetical protein
LEADPQKVIQFNT